MRKLKHVTGFVVDNTALELAFPDEPEPDEARKLLGLSILEALGRGERLLVRWSVGEDLLARLLGGTHSANLTHLSIDAPASLTPLSDEVVAALNGLESLIAFDLGDVSSANRARMQECVRLEHVQTLALGRVGVASLNETLILAHHIAPHARYLHIKSTLAAPPASAALPEPLLPALRYLNIQRAQRCLDALREIHLPALEHLHLSFDTCFSTFPYKTDHLPSTSTALHTITLSYPSLKRLAPPAALLARCADLSIRLSIDRRLASADALTRSRRGPADAGTGNGNGTGVVVASRSQALALEETLTWARNRARWLRETGDGPGLQELAEATVRLRERHLVHES